LEFLVREKAKEKLARHASEDRWRIFRSLRSGRYASGKGKAEQRNRRGDHRADLIRIDWQELN
jgi:hypothetical protein